MKRPSDLDLESQLEAVLTTMATDATASVFYERFFSLDPTSVSLLSRDELAAALPMRQQLFATIGATGTHLRSLEVSELDTHHVVATTTWDVEFADPAAEQLVLESSFLLRRAGESWSILAYINHRDIAAVIAERRDRAAGLTATT